MSATPGGSFRDGDLMCRGVPFQVFSIIRKLRLMFALDVVYRIGEGQFAALVMMAISFPVGCNVNDLWPGAAVGKCGDQALGEVFTALQQTLERDCPRDWGLIK